MNNKITSENLAKAAALCATIETVSAALVTARAEVAALEAQLAPVQTEYNTILGIVPAVEAVSSKRFDEATCTKISVALKKSWANRKAVAKAAADKAASDAAAPAVADGTAAPAVA